MNRALGTVLMMISIMFGIGMLLNAVVVEYNYVVQYHKDHPDARQRKTFDSDDNRDHGVVDR